MAKYKVKVIGHMIKGNKIAKSGDIVDESQLINKDHSVDGGYVELYIDLEVEAKVKAESEAKVKTSK